MERIVNKITTLWNFSDKIPYCDNQECVFSDWWIRNGFRKCQLKLKAL